MKKVILFLFLIVFSFLKSKTQNRIDIIGNGTYCTIKEDGVIKIVGSYRPYPIICNNDTTSISINIDWGITKRIYYSNCILISKIFVNNIQITSYTNLLNILGSIYPATGSGGGGGGSYTFAGNIVNQSGNNIVINQVQPDWNALSGLGSIANKPNIPILDSTQFVKLRDSNKNNNGFITPSFFFANRGGGGTATNYRLATMDSIGVVKTGKYIRNNTNYNFSQAINTLTTSIQYINGNFLRGSSTGSGNFISRSTDGINWTSVLNNYNASKFTFYKGNYLGIAYNSNTPIYSADAVSWSNASVASQFYFGLNNVNDTIFLMTSDAQIYYSTSGSSYFQVGGITNNQADDFAYNGKVFVKTRYTSSQLQAQYLIKQGVWQNCIGINAGDISRKPFYSTTKKMFIIGSYNVNSSFSYYSYDGINYNKCIGVSGDANQVINIREINGVIFMCTQFGVYYSYDGINYFKTNLTILVNDILYSNGVLYSANGNGTSISYSYDGIFWFTTNYSGIGDIKALTSNNKDRILVGSPNGVFYNSSLKTDSTLIANITKGLYYDSLGNINIDSNYIKYLIRNNTSGGGGGTTDTTSLSNRINLKLDVQRFIGDSVKRDTSIANRVIGGSVDTIANVITLNKTNGSNINLQLRKAGGGGGGTATNYPLATMDSIGVIKTGKYIRNNTNYNFSQSNITTPTIKVDYLNGLFLRGSSYNGDANLWTSTDGVNWTSRASGVTNSRFLYYKGKYFAQRYTSVGNIYSSDGITWDNTNNNGGSAQIVNDTLFTFSYAVNQSGYSTDGITFSAIDPNMQGFGEEFVYSGKGVFVATNYASGQLTPRYFIRGGEWTQINGVDNGTVCRAAFYSTTKKIFILGHYGTNNSYSYYSYDGINYNKCTGMGGGGSQIINIREINGVIFACGNAGIFYSYDGINFFKTNLSYIIPVNDITYNAGVLYSSNLDGTSISYSYDGIFWFTNNYSGIGVIESIAGNGSNRVVVGTSTGVFYNSSLKTDSTLIANITKGLFYDSLGNINIDSNYIKYLIRNNTSGGGGGGTTDTTSLSNRINLKLDVQRFSGDSTSKQNSLNFLRLNKIDSVTINGDTTLLTFYRNGVSSYNIQLKRASGGVVGISTKWNNLSISGYQVQKINDSTYNINRDNTIIQDSIRINAKLDVARFTADSIRWDTAIANRIITQRVDTISNRIYYTKTNGKIDSLQLRLTANAGGASINNDSIVHPYPYPYKDTVNIISTTDKVVNLGTNNKALINFNESIKVTQLFTTQTNVNGNARNGKFIRYGNTFQTFAGNVLLSSADGSTFTQLTTSQIMSANNQYTTIEAMDLSGDSLIVLTSAGGGNYILCILGSLGNTILYRSASFTISDGSGSFVTDISKIQLLGTSLYAVNGASFNNYLIKINIVNLTSQTIATTGSPAAFFKSTTNLYFLDYSGWYYEINAPTTRILKISNNAVSDATLLENRYICVSDYIGNIYVADMTINKVVDYINDVYFGSSDISVYAFGNILYVFDGTATTLYVTASQFSFNNLIVNTLAPFMFNSSLLDSVGSSGSSGQSLLSQNGKVIWGTPTQTYPLQSILIWGSTASGAAQNPQLSFQSNNIGLSLSGTGVTLPAGTYQIILVAGMPAIDNSAPYPISFFKFGLSSTIDATFPTYNEIRGCINKASSPAGNTDVLNNTFSITLTVTTSTIYYVTTYINRGTSAAMSGFVNIVRIK